MALAIAVGFGAFGLGAAVVLYFVVLPQQHTYIESLEDQLARREKRVSGLEQQLSEYDAVRLGVGTPMEEEGSQLPELELPEEVDRWIETGFEDPMIQEEYREYAATLLDREPELEGRPAELIQAMRE